MTDFLTAARQRLTEEDRGFLQAIYAPKVVAVPPSDAFRDLCVLPDGEIRCYGQINKATPFDKGEDIYIASTDCGLSWKTHRKPAGALGAAVKSPYSNRWLAPHMADEIGSCMRISEIGPNDTAFKSVPLDLPFGPHHPPIALRSMQRWVFAADCRGHSAVFLSDDDGDSWRSVEIEESDHFHMEEPHKGLRWENSGQEPAVTELADGTLLMVLRTSTDHHYACYSYDHGDSWTKPAPTAFHSTLTNPELLRLSDGRILFFFNNTRPLPEQDKATVWPPLTPNEQDGTWEDVFTNRDANSVILSDDEGKSWRGFRELLLNPLRNTCDFRTSGGNAGSSDLDKSVHQFQAIELPFNKILVQVGQHELVRKLVIFDVDWLLETERTEDFRMGLSNVSTQVYLKSISGCYQGWPGHCAWNRTNGAVLVPDPAGDRSEALLLKNTADDRLVSNAQGVVWNFPAASKGTVTLRVQVRGDGLRVSLLDHWTNPIDLYTRCYANFSAVIEKSAMQDGLWTELTVSFDTVAEQAVYRVGETLLFRLPMTNAAPNGLCYLHLQTVSEAGDREGSLIKLLHFSAKNGEETP